MKKIVLAGGTGRLGSLLKDAFVNWGWEVVILTRQAARQEGAVRYVHWDGEHQGPWVGALAGVDTLINLSGQSIQCRFTAKNRALLHDSRILPTQALGQALAACEQAPRLWINFSGISLFSGLAQLQDESSQALGTDFLAELTQQWERSFKAFDGLANQAVLLRVSPVLSRASGLLAELLPLTKWGLGGKVGHGKQYISWIHEQDLLALLQWIIEHPQPHSVYHACSPCPSSNAQFMQALRKAVGISFGLPLPRPLAHVGAFLKGVDPGLLLQSVPAVAARAQQEGFQYRFASLEKALSDLL